MKKILLVAVLAVLSLTSCDKWLDINQDPNAPQEVIPELVLPQVELALANTYAGTMYNHASFIIQYFDQGVGAQNYKPYTRFSVEATTGNRAYSDMYNLCLNNAEYVRTESAEEEQWGNYLAATTLKVFALQALVDLFGEVPYSEAVKGAAIPQPRYDDGSAVYAGILAELDDALSRLGNSTVTDKNLLFGANSTAKWVSFAKALKLKLLMRQASINWSSVKNLVNALIAENDFPTQDVAFTCWEDNGTRRNPWYTDAAIFFGKTDHMAASAYVNTLLANADPRLEARFDLPETGGITHKGGVPGIDYNTTTDPKTNFSTPKFVATAPAYIITVAEVFFFKAEAALRNEQMGEAQAAYEAAIEASFAQAGVGSAAGFYAAAQPYAWTASDVNSGLEQIALQKWIALGCVNGFESWCEVRRLGKPGFCAASADAINGNTTLYETGKLIFPKNAPQEVTTPTQTMVNRYYYPLISTNVNSNAPAQKSSAAKIFWQQ